MNEVFICYRRSDSRAITGRIYEHLSQQFGSERIFKDIESVAAGEDFRAIIEDNLNDTRCVLVVMGDQWLQTDEEGTLLLAKEEDYVAAEIRQAIEKRIHCIPILIDEARMPSPDDLPGGLNEIVYRSALPVRSGADFNSDIRKLTKEVSRVAMLARKAEKNRRRWIAGAVSAGLISVIGFFTYPALFPPEPVEVKVGIKQWIGYTPLAVAHEMNLFPKHIRVSFEDVRSASAVPEWVRDGKIDIGFWTIGDHVNYIEGYKSIPNDSNRPVAFLKVDTSRGADGFVAKGEIKSISDLVGKNFYYQADDVSDFMLKRYCEWESTPEQVVNYHSLVDDIELAIDIGPEDAAAKLKKSRDTMAVGTYEPHMSRILDESNTVYHVPGAHILLDSSHEAIEGMIVDIGVTRHSFLQEDKDAIDSFLIGWFRAVELLNKSDPKAVEIARRFNADISESMEWASEDLPSYKPLEEDVYKRKLFGLTGERPDGTQEKTHTAWPTLAENKSYFEKDGIAQNLPSKFQEAVEQWRQFLRKRSNLDPNAFDGTSRVLKLKPSQVNLPRK